MQFIDLIQSCPNWTLVDFYVDQGQNAPKMENAPEWCRLLDDCFNNKVDLIITHKVSNVSRDADELTFCAGLLSARKHPVGMYFIGEDIFTLASYYHNTRKEIHELTKKMETPAVPSVKDMPAYDPDAEAVGLTLTIPTWASSISRVKKIMDKTKMSREARKNLVEALKKLKNRIDEMLSELGEEENDG